MTQRYLVKEVINYGGFFAGDTVSLVAVPYGESGPTYDFTIDEGVFENLADRHKVVAGMVLGLTVEDDDKVTGAHILAAESRDALRAAVDEDTPAEKAYRVFAYRCPRCDFWVRGEPEEVGDGVYECRVCEETFEA